MVVKYFNFSTNYVVLPIFLFYFLQGKVVFNSVDLQIFPLGSFLNINYLTYLSLFLCVFK